ncbi:MAG: anion transporter [Anaerolineae bacterium]|nr:anion transporter [Thermoflexales bacterium]MDW8406895.1 anion transporter [Anaerolineae bacterium]
MTASQLLASAIALATLIALAAGSVPRLGLNRATMSLVGAGALLALGVISLPEAEKTIDLSTLLLLLSMMIINAVLELAGFFTWAGELIIERANAPTVLLVFVTMTSGVLSALFLNDPVCVMLTPLVCSVVIRLRRDPIPYLIALATAANVGSTATITGNPQNILIGISSGLSYLDFLARLAPVALIGLLIVIAVVWLMYPAEFRGAGRAPETFSSRRVAEMHPPPIAHAPGEARREGMTLGEAAGGVYAPVLRKSVVVIVALLVGFIAGAPVALAAFLAACALLVSRRVKSERILVLVDWPLLLLFCGLFVVTGSLEITGVSQKLFDVTAGLAQSGPAALTVVTALLSNLISNVPAVLVFRPLIPQFPDPTQAWLTLAAASTLAGNLTLIGSVANLIVAEQASKFGIRLTFGEYLRCGVPITVMTLAIAVLWLSFN